MNIQNKVKRYKQEMCKICANKRTDLCHIVVANGVTKCSYFVNEELQHCMQRDCKTCKKVEQCFKDK